MGPKLSAFVHIFDSTSHFEDDDEYEDEARGGRA
jgi:hypothetical protein